MLRLLRIATGVGYVFANGAFAYGLAVWMRFPAHVPGCRDFCALDMFFVGAGFGYWALRKV
jgi:hypothetical protein